MVGIDAMQFRFMAVLGTMDAIFIAEEITWKQGEALFYLCAHGKDIWLGS